MVEEVMVALVLGLGVGAGVALAVAGLRGLSLGPWSRPTVTPRLGLAVAAGAAAGLATGWPVAVAAGAALGAWLPGAFAGRGAQRAAVARAEAVAAWTEMLRDTRAVGVGLGQAVAATAAVAPAPIAAAVTELASRARRQPLAQALGGFAAAVDDRTADLVVAALVAAERRSGHLEAVLSALAAMAREEAAMRARLAAATEALDASVRIVCGLTVAVLAGLLVANRGFLSPYDSAGGQVVLGVVALTYAGSFAWLARLRRLPEPEAILAGAEVRP